MRRLIPALFFLCSAASAEQAFIQKLDGLAAQCAIDGSGKYTEAEIVRRDHGEYSQQYKQSLDLAYTAARECVETNLPIGREAFKTEVARSPHLKDRIADTYAAWMGYMEWLSTPHSWATNSTQGASYEAARNRLQAELDIQ